MDVSNGIKPLIKRFLQLEAAGGIILLITAIIALVWANSPWADAYLLLRNKNLAGLVNDGLMTFFFLIVGLELKQHALDGDFNQISKFLLPLIAALGGMIVPVVVYIAFNYENQSALRGWAIPVATDIAFALGVLQLFGRRVPGTLKLFLLALAIFDDVGAIIIIAVAFTQAIHLLPLLCAGLSLLILCSFNYYGLQRLSAYISVGLVLWLAILKSGIHPTVAGVLIAFTVPGTPYPTTRSPTYLGEIKRTPIEYLEANLHPWVAYLIMPLFALVNAGFSLNDVSLSSLSSGVVLGSALGLFLGKQCGIIGATWGAVRLKITQIPPGATWLSLYGVALLCGIGFTMSLFLGTLSFHNESLYLAEVRLGVMLGSVISGVCGATILTIALLKPSSGGQD